GRRGSRAPRLRAPPSKTPTKPSPNQRDRKGQDPPKRAASGGFCPRRAVSFAITTCIARASFGFSNIPQRLPTIVRFEPLAGCLERTFGRGSRNVAPLACEQIRKAG